MAPHPELVGGPIEDAQCEIRRFWGLAGYSCGKAVRPSTTLGCTESMAVTRFSLAHSGDDSRDLR